MDLRIFANFETAGQAVLGFLHERLGFNLWMITPTEGKDWIVLQSEDHGYDIKPGQVFRWAALVLPYKKNSSWLNIAAIWNVYRLKHSLMS